MAWVVLEHPDFAEERAALPEAVRLKLAEAILVLEQFGPQAGRPLFDTLKGSRITNLKEIRVRVEGEWRFAFAFDPTRQAVILVGGDKEGVSERRFYGNLIAVAEARWADWTAAKE